MPRIPTLALGLSLSLTLSSLALGAPDGFGPPYYDSKRSLKKQSEAAREGKKAARAAGPAEAAALLGDSSVYVRDDCFEVLRQRKSEELMKGLGRVLLQAKKSPLAAAAVAELYERCRYEAGRKALEKAGLKAKNESVVLESIWALERIGSPESSKALEKTFKRRHPNSEFRVQGDALIALAVVDPKTAEPHIEKALKHKVLPLRIAGLVALGKIDRARAAKAAISAISAKPLGKKARSWEARILFASVDTLGLWLERSKDPALAKSALQAMIARLERAEGLSKHVLAMGLFDLTGEQLGDDPENWQGWWDARKDSFTFKDKAPPKKKTKKKRKSKKKKGDKDEKLPGEADKKDGRVETGKEAKTRVRFHGIPIHSNRLLFAQDVSGGMNGPMDKDESDSPSRMIYSAQELKRVLKALGNDVWTNVCFFATEYSFTADRLFPIKRAREKLIGFVDQKAVTPKGRSLGRSNLYDTLAVAFEDPEIDTVFFLSEGGPTEGQFLRTARFMRHLTRINVYSRVRVHCLQITKATFGEKFLRKISEVTGGKFYDLEFLQKARGK
ncbi:MAG: hypothetical protein JKY65_15925 [Planctomycetes bacterium]|nr:hypothetical protein [Planctomycetota bacterium]